MVKKPMDPKKVMNVLFMLIAVSFLDSCKDKDEPGLVPTKIDVNSQWQIDETGVVISNTTDGQWVAKTFIDEEINLFKSLDTISLDGTIKPFALMTAPLNYNSIYPNPFSQSFSMNFRFLNNYEGPYVMKYVVVDSLLNPVEKKALKGIAVVEQLPGLPSSSNLLIAPNFPKGKYRFYYTLSAKDEPHFYKSWGNIQRD
jgi:hypothetical protein